MEFQIFFFYQPVLDYVKCTFLFLFIFMPIVLPNNRHLGMKLHKSLYLAQLELNIVTAARLFQGIVKVKWAGGMSAVASDIVRFSIMNTPKLICLSSD